MGVRDNKKLSINPAFFQEIKEDRQELALIVERLGELTADTIRLSDNQQEFIRLLSDFRDQLALHFTLEEAYGYFEEALDVAPHLHREAQRLKSQHTELYEQAQKLADAADERPIPNIELISNQAKALIMDLEVHETSEAALIQSAMQVDLGAGD